MAVAWYITRLLIELMPKGVAFSFFCFLFSPLDVLALLQVPGLWSLLGAAVVCSTTMLLGWDEKRQHGRHLQALPQQTPDSPGEVSLDELERQESIAARS